MANNNFSKPKVTIDLDEYNAMQAEISRLKAQEKSVFGTIDSIPLSNAVQLLLQQATTRFGAVDFTQIQKETGVQVNYVDTAQIGMYPKKLIFTINKK